MTSKPDFLKYLKREKIKVSYLWRIIAAAIALAMMWLLIKGIFDQKIENR